MTTASRLLARKQQLLNRLQEDPDPHEHFPTSEGTERPPSGDLFVMAELVRSASIQLNERVSLRSHAKAMA